jgi:hypothetical protein
MTKKHIIAFLIGCAVATIARNAPINDFVRLVPQPRFSLRTVNPQAKPRAVLMEGEFPVCSIAIDGNIFYTAGHCVRRKKEGDEVEVLLEKGSTPVRVKVYLRKVYNDIAILSFSKTDPIDTPKKVEVKAGARVVAVLGCLLSDDPDVYRASLPYFEREGKILAIFTAKEIGITDLLPNISPTAKFAIIDIGTFGGNSGSGVYIIDRRGKRHLIGVVSAGISDYTAVALF